MQRRVRSSRLLCVCAVLATSGSAQANLIPRPESANLISYVTTVQGQFVGALYEKVGAVNSGSEGLLAWFETLDVTQDQAAQMFGGDHFQWFQIVTQGDGVGVKFDGTPLVAPYIDPPLGGVGDDPQTAGDDAKWFDELPWYWDEPPTPANVNADPLFQLDLHLEVGPNYGLGQELEIIDFPSRPTNMASQLSFETYLVCVDALGGLRGLCGGFKWSWAKQAGSDDSTAGLTDVLAFEVKNQYGIVNIDAPDPNDWHFYGEGTGGFFTPPEGSEVGMLIAGSPIAFATNIDTPALGAFMLGFEHWFQTTTGTLQVLLNGEVLLTLNAPSTLPTDFVSERILISDAALRGLHGVELAFLLDGPTGSQVWIDNVFTVEAVPEPMGSLLIAAAALLCRRRHF